MKKFFYMIAAIVFFTASSSHAGVYVSGAFGYNDNKSNLTDTVTHASFSKDVKNAPVYAFAVGYELPIPAVSVRGELEYLSMDVKSKDAYAGYGNAAIKETMRAGMANAYVRVPVVGLYGGVGAGYGYVKNERTKMYQVMGGFETGIPVLPVVVGLEYRRVRSGDDFKNKGMALDYKSDALMLKARFTF